MATSKADRVIEAIAPTTLQRVPCPYAPCGYTATSRREITSVQAIAAHVVVVHSPVPMEAKQQL